MNNKSCLLTIKHNYQSLTKVEKAIADFILKNPDEVIKMSVSEFSEKCDVVKSAVIRCSKSLGFEGFSELKMVLAMELSKNKQLNYIPYIGEKDEAGDILDKIFSANIKTLYDTAEKINRKILADAVEVLKNAKTIYIYAVGTSSGIANDFQYRLMQQGFTAFCFTDVAAMKVSAMNIKEGDAAIGISHSGRTEATVDSLVIAKQMGAKTICITSCPKSQITKSSDFAIEVFSDEIQYPIEAVSARIAHISVTDAITVALSSKNREEAARRSKLNYELINTLRYEKRKMK